MLGIRHPLCDCYPAPFHHKGKSLVFFLVTATEASASPLFFGKRANRKGSFSSLSVFKSVVLARLRGGLFSVGAIGGVRQLPIEARALQILPESPQRRRGVVRPPEKSNG